MENENHTGPAGDGAQPVTEKAVSPDSTKMALTDDGSKVKFTTANSYAMDGSRNGEAKVEIENVPVAFAGMGKEELMKFANDPFWIRMRWFLFVLFWLAWIAMLGGAIIIIVLAPRCAPIPTLDWWQKNVVYQVLPRSFQDSNGDGVGDLKGIQNRLDHFEFLGVKSIWLTPFYSSPHKDFGYDVNNYMGIDPAYGTMEDFESLVRNMTAKEMHMIVDFIPNHTSNLHEWFVKSKNKTEPYTNYYIWADGKNGGPPNNWISVFGGSAWTLDADRGQYYFHQFLPEQPDLNLRNEDVKNELKKVLEFWLDKGVDGFRVDAVPHMYEDAELRDDPPSGDSKAKSEDYDSLDHKHTKSQPENLEIIREWRTFFDEYSAKHERPHVFLMVESMDSLNETMKYYGNTTETLADFPFNFLFVTEFNKTSKATDARRIVESWLENMPSSGSWPNWVLGNHDVKRVADRIDSKLIDGLHMITMLMRGTPVTYYGEEIGMVDTVISGETNVDPLGKNDLSKSRDPARTPMQWDSTENAGFSSSPKTWLPVNQNYKTVNVQAQQKEPLSHLNIYKKLVKLREQPSMSLGSVSILEGIDADVFGFSRVKRGSPGYIVLVNFGITLKEVNLNEVTEVTPHATGTDWTAGNPKYKFGDDGTVEVVSSHMPSNSTIYSAEGKTRCKLKSIPLGPKEGVVIKFVPNFDL